MLKRSYEQKAVSRAEPIRMRATRYKYRAIKSESRNFVVDTTRKILSTHKLNIPYVTLAHDQTIRNSEIAQLIEHGFLSQENFYGIDSDLHLIRKNQRSWPQAHWYHGDITSVIRLPALREVLSEAVIHLDTTNMYKKASSLLEVVAETLGRGIIFYNVIQRMYGQSFTEDANLVESNTLPSNVVEYTNARYTNNSSIMHMVVFVKE